MLLAAHASPMPLLAQPSRSRASALRAARKPRAAGISTPPQWRELEPLLEVADYPKGETLEHQGDHSMEQYFIIDGILKRVVSNAQGKEMILRFAAESDIDTSYAAWRLKKPIPYAIRTVTRVRAAKLSMQHWVSFLERHPDSQERLRARDHEAHERSHGAHDHAAPPRCERPRAALHAQAPGPRRAAAEERAGVLPEPFAGDALAGSSAAGRSDRLTGVLTVR